MPPLLASLRAEEMDVVVRHPVQRATAGVVSQLVTYLRECESPADYNDFQRLLFQCVVEVERSRAAISHVRKRLRRGLPPPADAPLLAEGGDASDEGAWRIEGIVHERVWRQLRSVGDALAWRVSGFNRRYVIAVSCNPSAGPMSGKAGLPYELGTVEEIWKEHGQFALLHDLTNCLRIGDVSEFTSDGRILLAEVKKSGRRDPRQVARMAAAIAAVNDGARLPGAKEQLVETDFPYATHLSHLRDGVALARERGVVGMTVPGGRALTVAHLPTMASNHDRRAEEWVAVSQRARATALRRARIDRSDYQLNMFTADWAGRSATAVPYGVYPLAAEDCAGLICDLVVGEVIMAPGELFAVAALHGMHGEVLLAPASGELTPAQAMFRLRRGNRAIVMHSGVTAQLLGELLALEPFVAALAELLDRESPPESPVLTFGDEALVWR